MLPLLRFCLSDLLKPSVPTSTKRKLLGDLRGCQLISTADGMIIPFPNNIRDRVVVAPLIFHALLPAVREYLVHPEIALILEGILSDPALRDAIFIENISSAFLRVRTLLSPTFPVLITNRSC